MGFSSLFSIVSKDLKRFTRPKLPAFVIILMPVLIILMAGFAFNSFNLSGVVVAVHSNSYTDLTEDILKEFNEQNFAVKKFNSKQSCADSVRLSKTQICIIFPDDLSVTGSLNDVVFYVDHSRLNLAYTLVNKIESKISSKASNLGIALAQDLINILESAKDSLPKQKTDISNSINKLGQINVNAGNAFPSLDIDNSLEYLDDVKDLLNDSEARNNIIETIKLLESIKVQVSDDLESIENQSEYVSFVLKEVSYDLNVLINSMNDISVLEAEKIVSPIKVKIESVNSDSNNRDYLIPTILALIALFGAVLLSSTLVLKERKTKAYFRNFLTPTLDSTFIFGSYLTCLIILSIQFLLIFAGIGWILEMPVITMLPMVGLILFVSLSVFIFLGMFIGYLFRSEETTIFASVLVATVLMFFSNTILPIETISNNFNKFAMFNPLVVSEIALKKVILFGFNIYAILPELYVLLGFLLTFAVLTYIGRKVTKRML